MDFEYAIRRGERFSEKAGRSYPVDEILVDGEVVGAVHSGDGYLFGEVQWADGTRKPLGDCTRNHGGAIDAMARWIVARRTLPADTPKREAYVDTNGWTVRRVEWNPDGKVYPHPFGDKPSEIHYGKPIIGGLDRMFGRQVRRCDGMLGQIVGPGTSWMTVVEWDDGTQSRIEAPCLSLVD